MQFDEDLKKLDALATEYQQLFQQYEGLGSGRSKNKTEAEYKKRLLEGKLLKNRRTSQQLWLQIEGASRRHDQEFTRKIDSLRRQRRAAPKPPPAAVGSVFAPMHTTYGVPAWLVGLVVLALFVSNASSGGGGGPATWMDIANFVFTGLACIAALVGVALAMRNDRRTRAASATASPRPIDLKRPKANDEHPSDPNDEVLEQVEPADEATTSPAEESPQGARGTGS